MEHFTCGICLSRVALPRRVMAKRPLLCDFCYAFECSIVDLLPGGCQTRFTTRGIWHSPGGRCACGERLENSAYAMRSPVHLAQAAATLVQHGLIPSEGALTAADLMALGGLTTIGDVVAAVRDIFDWTPPKPTIG